MAAVRRRTQSERRENTIALLLDATIETLADRGYSGLTVADVCERAKLSQGALFRHFGSRNELIAAATEEVCRRHLALIASGLAGLRKSRSARPIKALVLSLRNAARTPEHAAWHEVMVAARTHAELHALVAVTLQAFEQSLLIEIARLEPRGTPRGRLGTILLSVMHVLDSEAVTVAVYPNPTLEDDRVDWLVELLQRELAP